MSAEAQRRWLWLHARAIPPHRVPVPPRAAKYLDAHLRKAGIGGDAEGPLFRHIPGSVCTKQGTPTGSQVMGRVRHLARTAGLSRTITRHTLRVTGLASFLAEGGRIEQAMEMTGLRATPAAWLAMMAARRRQSPR